MKKYIMIGQGNPGKNYNIRHNLGFHFLDGLLEKYNDSWLETSDLYYSNVVTQNYNILLVKPMTGYNDTGHVVKKIYDMFGYTNDNLIVIHDDVDLSLGRIKVKKGGSSGGCNGIKSIDSITGTNNYSRIRIGIGRPLTGKVTGEFVCGEFTKEEYDILNNTVFPKVYNKFCMLPDLEIENLRNIV